jgi:osmotically-inducible protein OsmY
MSRQMAVRKSGKVNLAHLSFLNPYLKQIFMKSDNEIRNNVMEEIQWDPQLTKIAPQIGVIVKEEVVTLSGQVENYGQKIAAEQAAKRVKDVKVVAMDVEVKASGLSGTVSDSEIAEAVRNALTWHSAVNEDTVNIKVEDGWIYLEGEVNWEYERKAAEKAVENIRGVKGVINSVKIKAAAIEPSEVKKKIKAAFHRHAAVDSSNIFVDTTGNSVKLTGSVRSWTERKDAEDVAWSMPGVTDVENKLEIEQDAYVGE